MGFNKGQGLLTRRFKPARFKKVDRKPNFFTLFTRNNDLETSRKVCEETTNKLQRFLYIVLAVVVPCCFVKSLQGEFIHDDIFAVKDNLDVRTETPMLGLFFHDFWGKPMDDSASHKSYRPLCVLSFRFQYWLHGFEPFWYRLVNVWLHVLVTLMFAHVCGNVLGCTSLVSFMTALLFAVHPVHSEVVCSVVGRADILSCFLFLVAFKFYTNCIKLSTKDLVDGNRNYVYSTVRDETEEFRHWNSLLLCLVAGSAAMLAKETGITVYGVCVLYDIVIEHAGNFGRRFKLYRICVLTTMVVLLLYLRLHLQDYQLPQFSADDNPASHSDCRLTRVLTYSYLCFYNAKLLLAPATLCYDWQMGSIPLVESLFDFRNFATFGVFMLLGALFVVSVLSSLAKEERKILFAGLVLLTIPFLPASNLFFPVGFVVAERVLYIPSLGYCLIINFGFAKMAGLQVSEKFESSGTYNTTRCKVVSSCYVVMLALFVSKTWHQTSVWQSRGSLFRSGVEAVPHNAKVHYNYANYLKDIGEKEEAIQHYRIAIQLSPRHASFHNNLGTVLGNTEEAMKHFNMAIEYELEHANALLNLGTLLSFYNKLKEGEKYLRKSLKLSSQPMKVLTVLADVLSKQGRVNEVDELYKQTFVKFPHHASLYSNFGLFLAKHGRIIDAEKAWLKALKIDPTLSDTLFNYGILLKRQGRVKEACEVLHRCLQTEPTSPQLYQDIVPLFHHMGYLTEALDAVDTILIYFNVSVLQYQKGNILKDMKLYQNAIKSFQMAIELNVTNIDAYLNLGATHHLLKNFQEARFYYEHVLNLDSSHKVAKENLEKLTRL